VGNSDDDAPGGTDAGSAFVFVRSGGVWTQQAHLFASDAEEFDYFGSSVAISGDTAVVVAPNDDTPGGTDAGSAYVFVRSGSIWKEQAHLFASDGAAFDVFGNVYVAISGDTVVVGANSDDTPAGTDAGSAYIFVRSGGVWTEQAHLFASDGAADDLFGQCVAISGDTAVVGAIWDDTPAGTDAGSAFVFVRRGGVWTEQAHLFAYDGAAGDSFGRSVAISGDTAVVGASNDDTAGGTDAGSAYVFVRSGGVWTQRGHLFAYDGAADDLFGFAVAISGDTVVVGAWLDDSPGGTDAGSAYIFELNCPLPGDLNCDAALDAFDIEPFTLALFDPAGYRSRYPNCDRMRADINADGNVDAFDIEPFVELLFGP
jgi:predicted amidohydrolase